MSVISVELWQRLRRLDQVSQCEIVLCRTDAKTGNGEQAMGNGYADGKSDSEFLGHAGRRVWVVTIRRYAPPYKFEMVQAIRPALAEALERAIEEAEARGWSR